MGSRISNHINPVLSLDVFGVTFSLTGSTQCRENGLSAVTMSVLKPTSCKAVNHCGVGGPRMRKGSCDDREGERASWCLRHNDGGLILYQAYGNLYAMTALGWLLEETHVTWAHLGKKWMRLQLYTKVKEEKSTQTLETVSQSLVMASDHQSDGVRKIKTASGLNRHSETLEDSVKRRRQDYKAMSSRSLFYIYKLVFRVLRGGTCGIR
ncbi:hypothetical protein Tco_1236077 [Tanacetum coccineum]